MPRITSFPLALSRSGQYLHCSLHRVQNPSQLSMRLKRDCDSDTATSNHNSPTSSMHLALIDARRVVSFSQLCYAANLACNRNRTATWDTVFLSAASTHLGHVLKDYAFWRETETDEDLHRDCAKDNDEFFVVIVFTVSNETPESYEKCLEQYNLTIDACDLQDYLRTQREGANHDFPSWYKLTTQELASSTLEDCVLTKISTKMA
jgi:hypothetical protein